MCSDRYRIGPPAHCIRQVGHSSAQSQAVLAGTGRGAASTATWQVVISTSGVRRNARWSFPGSGGRNPIGRSVGPPPGRRVAHLVRWVMARVSVVRPESQFWPFQLIETGIFVALAAVLLALALHWIRRIT